MRHMRQKTSQLVLFKSQLVLFKMTTYDTSDVSRYLTMNIDVVWNLFVVISKVVTGGDRFAQRKTVFLLSELNRRK